MSTNVESYFVGLAAKADNAALKTLNRKIPADSVADLRILDGSAYA